MKKFSDPSVLVSMSGELNREERANDVLVGVGGLLVLDTAKTAGPSPCRMTK